MLKLEENLTSNIEHWASIDGYLNYQVSWWGRVSNIKTGRILKPGTSPQGYQFVVLSKKGNPKIHYIHKLVAREWTANPLGKPCVDHVNNDKTNNNHENLRWATKSENSMNMKKHVDGSSVYKGVSWHKKAKKWSGQIRVGNVKHHLGLFANEKEAAESYNAAAVEHYKEFAKLNTFND